MRKHLIAVLFVLAAAPLGATPPTALAKADAAASETYPFTNSPPYGIAAKRPVISGACPQCVWGPLAEFVRAAMKPYGWDLQICYNCHGMMSPRYVAEASIPHDLTDYEKGLGDPPPPQAPVDFGITETMTLQWAYHGTEMYKDAPPMRNLRLVAHIEDPNFLLIAAKKSSGITDLSQLRARKEALRVLTDGGPWLRTVLEYFGITEDAVKAHGGRFSDIEEEKKDEDFDLMVSSLASLANNLEANAWLEMSEKYDLVYFPIPQDLRDKVQKEWIDSVQVTLPYRYFRGVDKPIPTVGRSGHSIIMRADAPDSFAYAVAKAVDEQSGLLKWGNRPYSIDPRTVWRSGDVPLHPGAARYYRERGYLK